MEMFIGLVMKKFRIIYLTILIINLFSIVVFADDFEVDVEIQEESDFIESIVDESEDEIVVHPDYEPEDQEVYNLDDISKSLENLKGSIDDNTKSLEQLTEIYNKSFDDKETEIVVEETPTVTQEPEITIETLHDDNIKIMGSIFLCSGLVVGFFMIKEMLG